MTLLPEVRSQLYDAAERRSRSTSTRLVSALRRPHVPDRWRRAPLIAIALGFALAGGALAGGLIRFGAPARSSAIFSNPNAELGAIAPGTVRLLPIATPDPAGGPPWGMRVLSTTRGVGCIQVGRLVDGKLGAIGMDGAFGDDGRFHELPLSGSFDRFACAALDGRGRLFNNVTVGDEAASATWFSGEGGCAPPGTTATGNPHGAKRCAQSDERNLYYGLLGPDAKSIAYTSDGRRRTLATVGAEGAYLIVTKAPLHQLFDFPGAGTADVVPVDGPITEIHYRDGATCHLTARSWIGGASACTPSLPVPVGYVPLKQPLLTRAQVASPLRIRLTRTGQGRHEITISFTSRVAITSARSQYLLEWHEPQMPPQVNGYQPTRADIAAGQTITMHIGGGALGSPLPPGTTSGTVSLLQTTGPGGPSEPGALVGRFAVHVP
jgi:hypothetical protein